MTLKQLTSGTNDSQALLEGDEDYLRSMVSAIVQATPGAEQGEWTSSRQGYRSGYYTRWLVTRVRTLELRVPQDRDGCFSTWLF